MAARVRKGDQVIVTAGRDRGKKGEVLRILPKDGKVLVEGVNRLKKHLRPTRTNQSGGIIVKENPIPLAKVMLVDPKSDKPTRVRFTTKDGKKVRVAVSSGATFEEKA